MGHGKISLALCMLVAASAAYCDTPTKTGCTHAAVKRSYVQISDGLFIEEALQRGQRSSGDRWLEVAAEPEKKSALPSKKLFRCPGCGPVKPGAAVSICKKPSNALIRDVLTTRYPEEDFFEWLAIPVAKMDSLLPQADLRSLTNQVSRGASK